MTAYPEWVTPILTALGGALAGGLALKRRLSRESVDGDKDRAERGLISRLQVERDEAREEARLVRKQATDDARTIASLTSDNMHLRSDCRRLAAEVRKRTRGLPEEVQAILDTQVGDFDSKH